MTKKVHLTAVSLTCLLLIARAGLVQSQETIPTELQEATAPQSIHQRASICFENLEATFPDEPLICQDVFDRCHNFGTVVPDQLWNPEALTTDKVYLEDLGDEVNWGTIGSLQQSCMSCHNEELIPETNHPIFVKHDLNNLDSSKETELKLFDGHILCTTCHNPHRENSALLRVTNLGSGLCLDCHVK